MRKLSCFPALQAVRDRRGTPALAGGAREERPSQLNFRPIIHINKILFSQ